MTISGIEAVLRPTPGLDDALDGIVNPIEACHGPSPRICFAESSVHFPVLTPVHAGLNNDLIAQIPEGGSLITNEQIHAALEEEAGEPLSDDVLEEVKNRVLAMGHAEKARGPGSGLKAPGVSVPLLATAANPARQQPQELAERTVRQGSEAPNRGRP